ncbi:MAG: 2-oxoacid:acceptor oxidoreductase family protein [Anaerolinea sp.]|nr:2-oxoacid:acceptor oxidoreductase family protein [Anaerolinea sp.]
MHETFVFAGFGGQGVMFAGQTLAYAAMGAGLEVTWIPSYGPEMRGGTANCTVAISSRPIGSPVVRLPRVGVVFNTPSYEKYEPIIEMFGILARNASLVKLHSERKDITELAIPAQEIAEAVGDAKLANVVMLGAVLSARPVIPLEAVRQALQDHIPVHRRSMLDMNYEALNRGTMFQPTEVGR